MKNKSKVKERTKPVVDHRSGDDHSNPSQYVYDYYDSEEEVPPEHHYITSYLHAMARESERQEEIEIQEKNKEGSLTEFIKEYNDSHYQVCILCEEEKKLSEFAYLHPSNRPFKKMFFELKICQRCCYKHFDSNNLELTKVNMIQYKNLVPTQ